MMKKILAIVLVIALTASISIAGTMAYLTSEDEDVNVMVMGNVKIEQHEYERVQNADGTYEMVTSTSGTGYKLQGFTQAKPLYPATGSVTGWGTTVYADQLGTSKGGLSVFEGIENAQDKFISVENTGKTDAYVRTLIAFEQGTMSFDKFDELVMMSLNDYSWNIIGTGTIAVDNNNYYVFELIYKDARLAGEAGVLPAGAFTSFSLGQVYLKNEATNEDCVALDGNNNGTYDILVLSQAVQTAGFSDAATALDTAFGEVNAANAEAWFSGMEAPVLVDTADELVEALENGDSVVLTADVALEPNTTIIVASGKTASLNLNGFTLSAENTNTATHNFVIDVKGGELTISNGTVTMEHTGANMGWNGAATVIDVTAGGVLNIDNATIDNQGGTDMNFGVHLNNWGEVTLNVTNSTIKATYCAVRVFNSGFDMNNVTIKDSTLTGNTRAFWVHNYIGDLDANKHSEEAIKARLNFDIFNNNNEYQLTSNEAKSPIRYGFNNTVYLDANGNIVE